MAHRNIWKLSVFFGALVLFWCFFVVCLFCMCVCFCMLFVFFKSVGALPRSAVAWKTDVFV